MIIFGYRSFVRILATLSFVCRTCRAQAAHRIVQRTRMFTLFFIPVIPLSRTRSMTCINCGCSTRLSKADADRLIGTGAPAPALTPPPPSQQPLPEWMPFPTGDASGR